MSKKITWERVNAIVQAKLKQEPAVVVAPGIDSTPKLTNRQLKRFYRYLPQDQYRVAYTHNGDVPFIVVALNPTDGFAAVVKVMRGIAANAEDPVKINADLEKVRLITNAQNDLNLPAVNIIPEGHVRYNPQQPIPIIHKGNVN